jgi:hypothetical protein
MRRRAIGWQLTGMCLFILGLTMLVLDIAIGNAFWYLNLLTLTGSAVTWRSGRRLAHHADYRKISEMERELGITAPDPEPEGGPFLRRSQAPRPATADDFDARVDNARLTAERTALAADNARLASELQNARTIMRGAFSRAQDANLIYTADDYYNNLPRPGGSLAEIARRHAEENLS